VVLARQAHLDLQAALEIPGAQANRALLVRQDKPLVALAHHPRHAHHAQAEDPAWPAHPAHQDLPVTTADQARQHKPILNKDRKARLTHQDHQEPQGSREEMVSYVVVGSQCKSNLAHFQERLATQDLTGRGRFRSLARKALQATPARQDYQAATATQAAQELPVHLARLAPPAAPASPVAMASPVGQASQVLPATMQPTAHVRDEPLLIPCTSLLLPLLPPLTPLVEALRR
jgi:hypothetical protein